MARAYMLLRDNRENGPFTIDELMQQQLRRGDLVWIEGESHAWSTPEEIPELKLEIAKGKTRPDEIELRAEALRKRIMEYKPVHIEWKKKKAVLPPVKEEPSFEFVDHRRRGIKMYDVLALLLVTAFGSLLYFGGKELYRNRAVLSMETATATASIVKPEEKIVLSAPQQPAAAYAPYPDSLSTVDSTQKIDSLSKSSMAIVKKPRKKVETPVITDSSINKESTASLDLTQPIKKEEAIAKEEDGKQEKKETERETVKETVKRDTVSKKEDTTSTPKKKKKGFFKSIFGGKD